MFKFLNLQPEIFGMYINDSSLRIVKLKKKRKGFDLVSFNEVNIQPGILKEGVIQDEAAIVKIIKSACSTVRGKKLDTKYVAVSLPEEKSFSQVMQMPKMTNEELKLAVPYEAENYIPLTIDKTYLDFQIINPHTKSNIKHLDLLINVVPKSIVDSYVSCFKQAGLIPCILEVESQSIVRALIERGKETLPLLLIDLGVSSTSFIIFSGNSVRFTSSVPISSKELTDAISSKLGIDGDKAEELKVKYGLSKEGGEKYNIGEIIKPILMNLVSQIKKYISFYYSHASYEYLLSDEKSYKKIEKIIICGGGANLKMIHEFLTSELGELKIPIEIGNPFINISKNNNMVNQIIAQEKALSFTTVLGLALRSADENLEF